MRAKFWKCLKNDLHNLEEVKHWLKFYAMHKHGKKIKTLYYIISQTIPHNFDFVAEHAVDSPPAIPTLLKLAESKITPINGTCSYLGVSSTYQSPSSTYLQESGTGGIQEGLIWLWAIMEMTVCYEALGRPCQIWTPSCHHPLHSLHYQTGDVSAPSTAKMLLRRWWNKGELSVFREPICHHSYTNARAPLHWRELQCWAPWKHVWCSCGAERSTSAGRDRPLERTTVPATAV